MKSKTIFYISEIANLIMIYMLLMSIMVFSLMMVGSGIDWWIAGALLLFVGGNYMVRTKCKNIFLFVLGYLALCVPTVLLAIQSEAYGMIIFCEVAFLMINMWWYATKLYFGCAYVSIYAVVMIAIFFIIADIKGAKGPMDLLFAFGMVYFFMNYVRLYCTNVNVFSREKERNIKMPYDEMIRNDSRLALPFMIGSILFMISLKVDFLDNWFVKIYMKLIVYIREGLVYIIETLDELFKKLFPSVQVEPMTFYFEQEVGEVTLFENIFSSIIVTLIFGFAVFLIITMVIKMLKSFEKKEFSTENSVDEIGMVEIRERIQKTKTKKEKLSPIRKQYKQTVLKCSKKGCTIYKSHTPSERAVYINKEINNDIFDLTDRYTKERYSKSN